MNSETLKAVGALLGLIAFMWNVWAAVRSYLLLGLEVRKSEDEEQIVRVSVTNAGLTSKMISYAGLLITLENMSVGEAVHRLLGPSADKSSRPSNSRNELIRLFKRGSDAPQYEQDCAMLPLIELYQEQAMVGPGEAVSYICSVDSHKLRPGVTYVVRFIVFISYARIFLRWRFTADSLRIAPQKISSLSNQT